MANIGKLSSGLALGLTAWLAGPAAAQPTFDELLSYVFFEDETATADTRSFFCRNIALTAPGDTCNAEFRVIDPNSCKVEVIREFRVTFGEGKGREFMRAREVFTVANLDLARTQTEFDTARQTARGRFEADIDIYRNEGFQYGFDLDDNGAYRACRMDGQGVEMPEAACVAKGTRAATASKKMSLLYSKAGFQKAMDAVRRLQADYCPAGGNKT